MIRFSGLFLLVFLAASAEQRWDIQYRYRQVDSTLTINDLAFPDVLRGIACGYITDRKEKDRPLALITSDGGANWTEIAVKESCVSLFFLNDSAGWMVTDKGIWSTTEAGRNWVKAKAAPVGMLRIWFLDRQHGFLAGTGKRVFETLDAGETWTPLPILTQIPGNAAFTTFGEIAFTGNKGIIAGWNIPPRRGGPDWMEAGASGQRREVPHYSVMLETQDAGKTWVKSEASVFGQITRLSLTPQGSGLGLLEFKDLFAFPSEVERINLHNGRGISSFKQKDRAITDVRVFAGSNKALIAGYETTGPVFRSPVPGKLRILSSGDLENWKEMPVDYRAVAHSAIIAGPDENHLWVATDTGMILKLNEPL